METKEPGKIITFYSYKGGTGRSMAVANVAWILASNEKRVLVIDWDLEAPGLHRYFYPFLVDKDLSSSEGLIDFVSEFAVEAATHKDEEDDNDKDWYKPLADILRYAVSLEWDFHEGTLDFIPAGRQGSSYSTRVNSFNWQHFYDQLGGGAFLEYVKQILRNEYDFILIDSRTGVSDTAGICTVQMPDSLVICFTLNNQSIDGASGVAESVAKQREIQVFPVPTRIENAEKDKRDMRLRYAQLKFGKFPNTITDPTLKTAYWAGVGVIYIPYYAYEEILAPFGDTPGSPLALIPSSEKLVSYLTENTNNKVTHLDLKSVRKREEILDQYAELARTLQGSELDQIRAADKLYSSFSPDRQEATRRLMTRLVQLAEPTGNGQDAPARVFAADLDQVTHEVVQSFSQADLIRKEQDEANREVVLLASDALIKGWSKLHAWIEVDREVLLWRQSLQPSLRQWRLGNKDNQDALRSLQLADLERWLSFSRADLNQFEEEFARASFDLQKRELLDAAECLADGLTPEKQEAMKRALMRMVRVARPVSQSEIERALVRSGDTCTQVNLNDFTKRAREAVQQLVEARLVLRSVDNDTSDELLSLSHGFLLDEWGRLRDWIEGDRPFLTWRQEMRASLAEWRRSRRDESLLLRDGKRTEAARWLAERTNDLNAGEHEYINASIDLQEREHIKTAERVFALLTPQEQEAARRVLKGLVRVADSPTDGDYTRSTLSIETLTELDRRVLKTFADAGLVTFESNKDSLEKEAHLADESLLKRWTRLSDWISEDRAFILWRQELRLMIEAWEDKEHNEDGLLHDIALAQAENWAKERNQDLTPKEYVYIAESRATQASIEKQYNRLSSEQQTATRRALTRMVRLDPSQDSSKDSPGSVRMDELDPSSKTAVLWLSDAGIVTLTVDTITGFDIAYLSDGSLLKRWQRLKDWIKEGREFLLWRQQLRIYIVAWENSSKDKNALLPDASLIAGKRWLKSREKDLNEREKDYLIESIRQYTRRRIMAAAVVLFVLVVLALLINRPSRKSPPPTPGIDALVVELNSQGRLALAFGDLQEAIEKYTQAVSIDPKFPESYINRGDAYLKTQEYDGAIADFSRAIELNPASAAAFKGRALGLFNKQNDKDAIADFTVAIDLNPQDSESYYSRGLAYASRKDYTPAIADFRKAIEVKADFGEAYLDLAYANLKKGDKSEAIANFQKASSTATDPAIRDAAQDELRRLGKAPNIAKVYVYYKEIKDKPVIDDLVARLKRRGFITVGPNLASDSTSGDVRYFDNEDQPIAAYVEKIVEYSLKLSAITLNVKTVSFVGQATKDEPHTIELRLPPLPVAPEFLDK